MVDYLIKIQTGNGKEEEILVEQTEKTAVTGRQQGNLNALAFLYSKYGQSLHTYH